MGLDPHQGPRDDIHEGGREENAHRQRERLGHFHRVARRSHFAIKLEKILLTLTKLAKLCDFSPSRNTDSTYEYMPLEVFPSEARNFRIDLLVKFVINLNIS